MDTAHAPKYSQRKEMVWSVVYYDLYEAQLSATRYSPLNATSIHKDWQVDTALSWYGVGLLNPLHCRADDPRGTA